MRRITRYVLTELICAFAVTLAAITTLLILGVAVSKGLQEGLGLSPIMRMLPYVVPMALQISVPATILMAASSVFGRMSADNEIVAIKSMGISPFAVIFPALALAFVVSLAAVWINDIAVSWGRTGMYRVVVESVEEVAYRMLKTQRAYQTRNRSFSINVKDVVGRTLVQPVIQIRAAGRGKTTRINASSAELHSDPQNNLLRVRLKNLSIDEGDLSVALDTHEIEISLDDATHNGDSTDSPSSIPLRRIGAESRAQREATELVEEQASTAAAFQMMTGDFGGLTDVADWDRRRSAIQGQRTRLDRLQLEPWRRWASGFSCFFFVLVGAPLAIQMKTANFFTTFAACFLPILLVYYPLLAFGVGRCKDGVVPPYTVWLGNLVLGLAGAWMVRRAIRY
jgi:lipopolysaccharide export system permease protein